jgi:tetratricopeptide (TPR) repeat protein
LNSIYRLTFICFVTAALFMGCASKKRKEGNPSTLSKFYHNTTALYNGYFNANELMKDSYLSLRAAHRDNYNDILPLYDYVSVENTKSVAADLDKAIEKVTTVASLHKPSKWVDDCYVLMGEAQYLRQDYESAEETFVYFKDEFNPGNPFGRNYKKKKKSKKQIKKEKEKERKVEKEAREKNKEEEKKAKDKAKEEKKKEKEASDKLKKDDREKRKKEREAAKKQKKRDDLKKKKEKEAERKRLEKEKKRGKKGKRGSKKRPKKDVEVEDKPVDEKVEGTDAGKDVKPKTEEKETPVTKEDTQEEKKEETKDAKENLDRERAEDSEETDDNSDSKKKEKKIDNTAYSKGMMWYAKTLVQRDKHSTASYMIKRMRADGMMPEDALREVPVILADINIREKNYYSAIENLEEAILLANDKGLKARYSFVKGQLHLINKDASEASEAFLNAKKWAKSFEMVFMSELNAEKTSMLSGSKSNDKVLAKLDRMIKEDKYLEYLDQLYFTKGEIQLEAGSFDDALNSFSQSIINNVDNLSLKQETYYKLAYLFYDKEDYILAKNYFDSTVQVLDKEDSRFTECSKYANNLSEVAMNIALINLQDSLLNMTTWTDDQIETLAERLIEEGKTAELQGKTSKGNRKSKGLISGTKASLKKSSFFAYDVQGKERGQKRFSNVWGDIELEDNWRRKDKSGIFGGDEDIADEEKIPEDGIEEDKIGKMISQIKSQIPYSDEAKVLINERLEIAFFELGKAYRDKIQNYDRSASTHVELLQRFPEFKDKLDVYYYLYLTFLDLNNQTKADFYKNKIVTDYPDTEFAKVISDPNYGKNKLSKEEKLDKFYEETYSLFEAGNYKDVYDKAVQSEQIFGKKNKLRPKFALLKAMATGSIDGKVAYVKALRDLTIRYPNSPEKARADEILRFLGGDKDAFTGIDIEEVDDIFSLEDDKLHYVAVVMYDVSPDDMVNSKVSISNYNKKYHKTKKLQLSDTPLNRSKRSEIILVRKFENKGKAMKYFEEVNKSKSEFVKDGEAGTFSIYAVSLRNYRKMIIDKSDARYRVFFDKHYLGK